MSRFTKDNLRNKFNAVFSDQQIKNINALYDYMKNTLQWSDRNIAAVLGNVMQESSFNYGTNLSSGAKRAFQFLGHRLADYEKWRKKNGYVDGALSQMTYLDYIIKNKIDYRMNDVIRARALLQNKNRIDSINANKVLDWAEPAIENGTFYPISDLTDALGDNERTLEDITDLWSNTIEKAGKTEKNNNSRRKYAQGFYSLMYEFGGQLNYFTYTK